MQIEIDKKHSRLVEQAVAEGRAPDAQSYVASLIDADSAGGVEDWPAEDREALKALLLERLKQEARPRPDNWRELIRQAAAERIESRV